MAAYQEETWEFDANGDPSRFHREEHSFEGGTARTKHVIQDFSEQEELELLKTLLPAFAQFQTRKLELRQEERQKLREHQIQQHYAHLANQRFQLEAKREAAQQQERDRQYYLEQRRQALEEQRAALEQRRVQHEEQQAAIEDKRAQVERQRAQNEADRIQQQERDSQRQYELEYQRLAEDQRQAQQNEQLQEARFEFWRYLVSLALDPTVSEETRQRIHEILGNRGVDTSQLVPPPGGDE